MSREKKTTERGKKKKIKEEKQRRDSRSQSGDQSLLSEFRQKKKFKNDRTAATHLSPGSELEVKHTPRLTIHRRLRAFFERIMRNENRHLKEAFR